MRHVLKPYFIQDVRNIVNVVRILQRVMTSLIFLGNDIKFPNQQVSLALIKVVIFFLAVFCNFFLLTTPPDCDFKVRLNSPE